LYFILLLYLYIVWLGSIRMERINTLSRFILLVFSKRRAKEIPLLHYNSGCELIDSKRLQESRSVKKESSGKYSKYKTYLMEKDGE